MNIKIRSIPFGLLASALLFAGLAVPAQAIDIVYSGTSQAIEQDVLSFIQGNFSDVNITYGDFSNYTANAAVIEAADLFIIGRRLSSGAYANEVNSASFNSLTVPVVAFTSYVTRPLDNRWGWHDGDVASGLSVVGDETTVTAAGESVFGVAGGVYDWFPDTPDFNAAGTGLVGDGEILATLGGNILAAHWNAGELSGTGATFGSDRFLFNLTEIPGAAGMTTLPNAAGQQALISALEAYTPLVAVSDLWNINGGGSFNVAGNWSENAVPTQNPVFGSVLTGANAPATVTLDSSVSLNRVSFQNPNQYILAGPGTLTLTGSREVTVGAGGHQITADIAGTAGFVKTGPGTLILSAAKSYTGTTDVQAGTLQLNNLDAIHNQAGGVLDISTEAANVLLGAGATGTLAAELTGIGQLNLGSDLAPADTVTISRSNASYDGVARVDGGTLAVGNGNALGIGGNTFNSTVVGGNESTGKVALSGGVNVANEVLTLEARENAGLDAVHLASTGNNTWGGNIVGTTGGTQYNIESTSNTLTLSGTIQAPDNNTRTFVFSGAGNTTLSGRLTEDVIDVDTDAVTDSGNNNVGIVKRGTGTLTIATGTTNSRDYWFGPTVVEQGTLAVTDPVAADAGELRSLDVTVKNGASMNVSAFSTYSQQVGQILRGDGTIVANTLALFDDGLLAPGDSVGQIGSLSVTGNVSLGAFAAPGTEGTWSFDVGNSTNTSGDVLAVSGSFSASGSPALTVNVRPVHGFLDDDNPRTIITHSGGTVPSVNDIAAQITDVNGTPLNTRQTVAVNGDTPGQINVDVTGNVENRTWNGNVSGEWDFATNNWQGGDQQFRDLDHVTFDDSASGTDITVDGPRFPGSVTFANAANDYTLSGQGGIVGTGSVNVTGTGEVTLANTGNNFSGATNITSGGKLRMTSANTGGITNAGTLSLGVPVSVEAFSQNGTLSVGTHKVFAIEAENFISSTINNSDVVTWDSLADPNASAGQALIATPTADNNVDTNLANQNYVTYGMKFTEPGEYFFYGRFRGEDHGGEGSTADDDSLWLPATDLGNGATVPLAFSTKYDGDQVSSARNAEGGDSNGQLLDFDWYISAGQTGGFDRIVVSPADVANGTVFQFGVATREGGAVFDKFIFVQDPDFATDAAFGTITDTDLDGVQVITITSTESTTTQGNILNVAGDFTMSGNGSVLNMLVGTSDIHDQINVSGNLAADGILNIESVSGSVVAEFGDVFDIFNFTSASGVFDDILLPALPGALDWDTSNLLITGELSVITSPGDFNEDGRVDGRDAMAWLRDPSVGSLSDWEASFGAGIDTVAAATVPEPGSVVLLLAGIFAGCAVARRRC